MFTFLGLIQIYTHLTKRKFLRSDQPMTMHYKPVQYQIMLVIVHTTQSQWFSFEKTKNHHICFYYCFYSSSISITMETVQNALKCLIPESK